MTEQNTSASRRPRRRRQESGRNDAHAKPDTTVRLNLDLSKEQRDQLLADIRESTAATGQAPYFRHYRVVAVDRFIPAPPDVLALNGMDVAERAERDLRARLDAGRVPQVMLISPERARRAVIGRGGRVANVFAWRADADPGGLSAAWTHVPHVIAELDAESTIADPTSSVYAERDSVVVRSGQLRRLLVSPWLAPVAGQLADRYEIPVVVNGAAGLMPARPVGEGSTIIREALTPAGVGNLLAFPPHPDRHEVTRSFLAQGLRPPRLYSHPHPFEGMVGERLAALGDLFNVDVNWSQYTVCEYLPGDDFPQHTDRYAAVLSWDRTVSFSLLLSEPGVDFEGGEFEVGGVPQELRCGDLVGFTALTPHAVRKITAGRRMVLIAFGEWRR